jgi:galacturonosyltransferase
MKVLILTNNDVGLYKFRKELLTELLKDNEVFISLPYGKFVDDMIAMGCHFVDAEFNRKGTNPIKDLKLLYRYTVILSEVKPDIVFT